MFPQLCMHSIEFFPRLYRAYLILQCWGRIRYEHSKVIEFHPMRITFFGKLGIFILVFFYKETSFAESSATEDWAVPPNFVSRDRKSRFQLPTFSECGYWRKLVYRVCYWAIFITFSKNKYSLLQKYGDIRMLEAFFHTRIVLD